MDTVRIHDDGAVRVVTLARPEVRNAIDAATAEAFGAALGAFAASDEVHVLVVTGEGGAFCAGADLRAAGGLRAHRYAHRGPLGFSALDPGKPSIAAIEGACVAGGMELAAWCDIRIAGEGAFFGALNRRWGVPFVDGGTQRFERIMGLGNALYVMETGARFDAGRACSLGFVQEVVPAGGALARATELAHAIAAYPQASLRADRASTLRGAALDLAGERAHGDATLDDPDLAVGLARFDRGDRPAPPTAR